jgi:hypothetical protein
MEQRKPNCCCILCNKQIYRRPFQIKSGPVYCSLTCLGKYRRKNKNQTFCPVCGKEISSKSKTCSRACSNKNRTGITYDNSNKYNKVFRSREVKNHLSEMRGGVCEKCGNENYNILQVHHIIEKSKGGTNEFSNLLLLCPNCHMTEHLGYSKYGG